MDVNDIIKITDVQVLDGYTKEILNVYYYRVVTLTAEVELPVYAEDLANAFRTQVITPVRNLQVSQLKHIRVDFENMTFMQEIASYDWDVPLQGLRSDDYGPAQNTYSFRLQRYSKLTRNGRKSISGVPDTAVTAGRTLGSGFSAFISAVSTAFSSPLPVEGDNTDALLSPIITRKPLNPGAPITVTNTIVRAPFRGFGTQNSRKEL